MLRRTSISALIVLVLYSSAAAEEKKPIKPASAKATKKSVGPVAVVDMQRLFAECGPHNRGMSALKAQIGIYDKAIRTRRAELTARTEELKKLEADNPVYKVIERDIATKAAQVKIDTAQKRKELLDAEASLYASTYASIRSACAEYCREQGIKVLIRYDSNPIDTKKRESVLKGVNRTIVFQDDVDVTDAVLEVMKRRARVASKTAKR